MIPFFEIKSDIKGKKRKRGHRSLGELPWAAARASSASGMRPRAKPIFWNYYARSSAQKVSPRPRAAQEQRNTTSNFPLLPSPGRFQLPVSTAPNSSGKLSRLLLFERGEKGGRGRRRRSRRSPPPPMASGLSGGGGDRRAPAVRHR